MTFGEKLRQLRLDKQLSQEALASKLGVSRQAVSKWEGNIALPDTNNLILIAKIFDVKIDELLNYNEDFNINNDEVIRKDEEEVEDINYEEFEKSPLFSLLSSIIFISCFLVFILVGIYINNGWYYSWISLLFIPILLSLIESIKKRKVSSFLFPVLVTAIYCFIGIFYGLWHPYWFLFILIPLFYIIAEGIDKIIHNKK